MYNKRTNVFTFEEDTFLPDVMIFMKRGDTIRLPSNIEVRHSRQGELYIEKDEEDLYEE